jgi:hypothetical protein
MSRLVMSDLQNENRKCESNLHPEKEDACSGTMSTEPGSPESPCKDKSISPCSSSYDLQGSTTEGEQEVPQSPGSVSSISDNDSVHFDGLHDEAGQHKTKDDDSNETDDAEAHRNHRDVSDDSDSSADTDSSEEDSEYDSDDEYEDWFEELNLGCAHEDEEEEDEGDDVDTVKLSSGAQIGIVAPEPVIPLRERRSPDPECEWYRNAVKEARKPPWRFKLKPRAPHPGSPKGGLSIGSGPIFLYLQRRQHEGADVLAGPVEIP